MSTSRKDKRFLLIISLSLIALALIALLQNYIRYGHGKGYDIWRPVVYYLVSVLFFLPVVSLLLSIFKRIVISQKSHYWLLSIGVSILTLAMFFIFSNALLHLLGYFDHFMDERFARYYFGREAVFHLLAMGATITYVYFNKPRRNFMDVTDGRKSLQILLDRIEWIEADDHYMQVHTDSGSFIRRSNMTDMAKELQPDFIRIHRKYLVNRSKIAGKERNQRQEFVILNSGVKLKVGRSYSPIEW